MADEELRAIWALIENDLRAALSELPLSQPDLEMATEFLDHNELDVAFQWVVSALADAGDQLPPDARRYLAAAASRMGLEDDPTWQRLDSGENDEGPP